MSVPENNASTPPADPPKQDPANPPASGQPPSTGTEPVKPATGEFDPSKLTDEQFEKLYSDDRLFRHPRFKSLSERARKADELEKAQNEAEQKALAEQGKYKELAEKHEKEAASAKQMVQDLVLKNAIQSEAVKLGIVDVEAAAVLIDKTNIKVKDDGSAEGVQQALEALIAAKPYLKGTPQQQPIGTGSNPNPNQTEAGTKKFKLSQIQDSKFWAANEKDIMQALKLGLVEDDLHGSQGPIHPSPQQT